MNDHNRPCRGQSPLEVFQAAMAAPPLTEFELAQKRSAIVKVQAQDERRRQPTPQLPLVEAA